jgi:hypothetical protein
MVGAKDVTTLLGGALISGFRVQANADPQRIARLTSSAEPLAAVPKPSTLAGIILGVALAGSASLRRRKRQAP